MNLRITTKDIKKEDRLCIESPPPDTFFQIHPYVFRVNFSNNTSIPLVRFIIRETEHDTAFEISSLLTLRINPFKILQNGQSSFFKWRFTIFRLLENAFIIYENSQPPWHDLLLVRLFKITSREIFSLENVCPPMKGIFGKYLLIL